MKQAMRLLGAGIPGTAALISWAANEAEPTQTPPSGVPDWLHQL